jgi:hypothetical protein
MNQINLKELWEDYSRLEENKMLTPVMIRKMIGERSHGDLRQMILMAYSSLAVFAGLIPLFSFSLARYGSDARFIITGLGGIALSLAGLAWTLYTLRKLRSVNFSGNSFVEARRSVLKVKKLFRTELNAQFAFMPLFLACVFPPIFMMVRNLNVFEAFSEAAPRIITGYILITILSVWMYRRFYFRKLDLSVKSMEEAEDLLKEEG